MKLDKPLEEKIVSSIAMMDKRMLDALLPDNGIYDQTYKEVWLPKLFALFDECQHEGDSKMDMYERMCTEEDNDLYRQKVYIFCAPSAKVCLMLTFVIEDGYLMGLQQYYGYDQLRQEKLFDTKHDISIGMDVYDNEMIGYVATDEHRALKLAIKPFEADLKNDRRKLIGRKWLLMMINKYGEIYQESQFNSYSEEVARFNRILTDFYNLYSFMRKPGGYIKLYERYKLLADKTDDVSKLKRRKLIGDNMLDMFSFYTSKNLGMNADHEFTYSYTIDNKKYTMKVHLRDTRIDVAGFFPFIKESKDVISHLMKIYKKESQASPEVYQIETIAAYFKGRMEAVLIDMDV